MKAHCISYPIKILLFCRLSLFFQNKARIANSSENEFIGKVYEYDNSPYNLFHCTLILLKLEHALFTADSLRQAWPQLKPDKDSNFAVQRNFFN